MKLNKGQRQSVYGARRPSLRQTAPESRSLGGRRR